MKIGVISDLNHTVSPAYSSYYYALVNVHNDVKLVHGISDLNGIDVLDESLHTVSDLTIDRKYLDIQYWYELIKNYAC